MNARLPSDFLFGEYNDQFDQAHMGKLRTCLAFGSVFDSVLASDDLKRREELAKNCTQG